MTVRSISETKRVRYLLGLSSPAERELIESEYFIDEDAFQAMLAAEDDLIDAYARGELTGEERRRFEKVFVSSLRGRDRVQFARAFGRAASPTRPVKPKRPGTSLNRFKTFQSPGLLRTATIVVVFVAVLAWLVNDRRRLINQLRESRAESAKFSERNEALERSSDTEQTRTAASTTQHADLRATPDKSRPPERRTTATQRARPLPEVTNVREKFEVSKAQPAEILVNREDASIDPAFERKEITQLPLNARDVLTLTSLQPATTRDGHIAGARANQSNLTLDGVDIHEPLRLNVSQSGETTIRIPSSLSWIRFELTLDTASVHEDYRVTIKTADGRHIISVDWSEPLTPNQTIIDTPAISTDDLPSGDYVLLLLGKEPDGSFVKVAEHSLKVIKY